MNNEKLKDLLTKIATDGDQLAFSKIFDYFSPRIMGYLVGLGSPKEIAEEITQEVLTTIWQKSEKFDYKKGNVNTWVFTISRNKRIDRLRRNENPIYNKSDLIEALYPYQEVNNMDLEIKIQAIKSNLNENEKKIINMNFFEGKSHKIISRDLEIPLGTVKSRIRNILNKMKNI